MCGIYGYSGRSNEAAKIVLSGLKKLDYRGYDSWGVAVLAKEKIWIEKEVGKISEIDELNLPKGNAAIGHTRWATNGGVTKNNAHPHFSSDKMFAVVQNGIVENFVELKKELVKKGYKFETETDTEVIVRMIEAEKKNNLKEAIRKAFLKLKGRNTIAVIDSERREIVACRNGSPLIAGKRKEEYFLSSDTLSLSGEAKEYIDLDNGEMAVLGEKLKFYEIETGKEIKKEFREMEKMDSSRDKGKYEYFMMKEIMESVKVIENIAESDKKQLEKLATAIRQAKHVYTIGSGTAGNAAAQTAYFLRKYAKITAVSLVGADAQEYFDLFEPEDIIIAPSQSGETSDVIEVLEIAKSKKMKIACLVNMPGSMMERMADFKFRTNSGPEICVMSTKVFTAQTAWGYLVAKTAAGKYMQGKKELNNLAREVESYLNNQKKLEEIKQLAEKLAKTKDIFLLGKGQNWQIAKEGMVKIIEGSYRHAHAIPAGDLKHYAITLIEKGIYVLALIAEDEAKTDVQNAINEIKSRGGTIIEIENKKLKETGAIFNILPLQLLAYFLAVNLGNNVDKPRNIAKSVTVK